ncbi:hypothetical protein BVG80_07410 [Sphingobacteriales bacterium TSM_CSM]|nr:hypothetical protein BVG80_07410 [Sphingobacteriales bacterium TSM_CSM]
MLKRVKITIPEQEFMQFNKPGKIDFTVTLSKILPPLKKNTPSPMKRLFIERNSAFLPITPMFLPPLCLLFAIGKQQPAACRHNLLFLTKNCPVFLCNAKYHATSGR